MRLSIEHRTHTVCDTKNPDVLSPNQRMTVAVLAGDLLQKDKYERNKCLVS